MFEEGDAEALPYGNGTFDAVASLIGAMFAPRPERVAAELTRVCRPGGIIAMANWTGPGFVGQMFKTIAKHIAPSGMPSPLLWGDEPTVRERLGSGVATLECSSHLYELSYPFSPADVVEFFRATYGPMTRAFASIGKEAKSSFATSSPVCGPVTIGPLTGPPGWMRSIFRWSRFEGTMQLIDVPNCLTGGSQGF